MGWLGYDSNEEKQAALNHAGEVRRAEMRDIIDKAMTTGNYESESNNTQQKVRDKITAETLRLTTAIKPKEKLRLWKG